MSATSRVGPGTVLLAQTVLTAAVTVGSHAAIMPHVVLTHDDVIDDFATLASGVCLGGDVRVGRCAYVGAGALVRERCSIGSCALVGMGAVVTRDIPPHEVWAGVPARYIAARGNRCDRVIRGSRLNWRERCAGMTSIPLVDLAAQHAAVADEVAEGWRQVLAQTAFIAGPQVAAFESEYAAFVGTRHCVGMANGTDAIEIALRALGVGPGDECIIPANTFIATAEAVCRAGATPVLVDCADDGTYLIDTDAVEAAMTPRTRAIIPVHLYGQTVPVERLRPLAESTGAWIVEDAAQSQGARRGGEQRGRARTRGCHQFLPGKEPGCIRRRRGSAH